MSMLSAKCDRLRRAAQTERDLGNYEAERLLLDAADTIWELSNRCVDVQAESDDLKAENAKLRKELDAVGLAAYLYGKEQLEQENAKLRELLSKEVASHSGMCKQRGMCLGCRFYLFTDVCSHIKTQDEAHELGIEVDA